MRHSLLERCLWKHAQLADALSRVYLSAVEVSEVAISVHVSAARGVRVVVHPPFRERPEYVVSVHDAHGFVRAWVADSEAEATSLVATATEWAASRLL